MSMKIDHSAILPNISPKNLQNTWKKGAKVLRTWEEQEIDIWVFNAEIIAYTSCIELQLSFSNYSDCL